MFQRDGRRCSNAKAFLHPALDRPNLTVLTDAHVLRILFEGRRAVGVETLRFGEVARWRAEREVLVAGGAIQTPNILQHSGIGPAAELRAFGVEVLEDLPVGAGFQDHVSWLLSFRTERESLITAFTAESAAQFAEHGTGPLTSNLSEAGGYLRLSEDSEIADLQIYCLPVLYGGGSTDLAHGVTLAGYPTKANIRGSVTLRSADPLSKPRIVHNYLSHPDDRQALRDSLHRAAEIADTPAFRALTTKPFLAPRSMGRDDLDDFIRRYATPGYHQAGSCPIGPVVDAELRVHGFEGLRIVDSSVMPDLNRGNTNAPTTMIAEKAADLIREISAPAPAVRDLAAQLQR